LKILLKTNQAFNDDKTAHSTFQAALHMIPWKNLALYDILKNSNTQYSCSNKIKSIVKKDLQQIAMTMLLATETKREDQRVLTSMMRRMMSNVT
jgi:hypothetical protein